MTHTALAAGKWETLSLAEQLANVGSEVDRAYRAWQGSRSQRFELALDRALELFDLTVGDPRWRGHRRREILRVREEVCRLFCDDEPPPDSAGGLSRVFPPVRRAGAASARVARELVPGSGRLVA